MVSSLHVLLATRSVWVLRLAVEVSVVGGRWGGARHVIEAVLPSMIWSSATA